MDLKLRQYEQGKAFCDGVVARAGIEGLNRVWIAPEAMPTVAELDDPWAGCAAPSPSSCAAPRSERCSNTHKARGRLRPVHVAVRPACYKCT